MSADPRPRRLHLIFLAVLSVGFTLAVIQYSFRHGRLLVPINYDDVGYFSDGLRRLEALYADGLWALARAQVADPPHSPFSSYLALTCFALMGIHDWAPYTGNALIVFAFLACVDGLLIDAPRPWRVLLSLFALTVPLAGAAVSEFRPDFAYGLLTAMGVMVLLGVPLLAATPRQSLAAGACFGLALLAKPTMFVLTFAVAGLSLALATLCELKTARGQRVGAFARPWGLFLLPLLVVPLPQIALAWRHYLDHFHLAILARNKPMPDLEGDWTTQVRFYLDGAGGQMMLANHLYLLLALLALGGAEIVSRRVPGEARRLGARIIVLGVALAIPTASPVKQPFFGVLFAFLLTFVALGTLRHVLGAGDGRRLRIARATILAVIAAGALWFRWPIKWGDLGSPIIESHNRVLTEIYRTIRGRALPRPRVFLTTAGFVGPELLGYLALKDGRSRYEFVGQYLSDDLEQHRREMDRADFVVASEPGNSEAFAHLPSARIEAETLDLVRRRRDYQPIVEIPTPTGGSYFVFERVRALFGWVPERGFLDEEGPYPQWQLGVVRWGCGPSSRLKVRDETGGRKRFVVEGRTELSGQEMTIRLDGREIGRLALAEPGRFYRIALPVDLTAGPHAIELAYATWAAPPAPPRAILFTTLQLVDADREASPAPAVEGPGRDRR